jgi:hypothetical protein
MAILADSDLVKHVRPNILAIASEQTGRCAMKNKQPLLKAADIRRFLAAKGWFGVCASCGHREFSPLDEDLIGARAALPVLKGDGKSKGTNAVLEVIIITCTNCGSAFTHERRLVADWIEANPIS